MPKQHKAYKFRLYPTRHQEILINKTLGCYRFIFNSLLAYNKNGYEQDKSWKLKFNEKMFKDQEEYSWLNEVSSVAIQQSRIDLSTAYTNFFSSLKGKRKGRKVGCPKFKKKGQKDSYRLSNQAFKIVGDRIRLQKVGDVKCVFDRVIPDDAKLCNITISKNKTGQFFASILVEQDIAYKDRTGNFIGIDLGIKDLFVMSNGYAMNNAKLFRNNQARLRKAQKHLSRKQKGSNRRNKQKLVVAKIYRDITNQRTWLYHNITTWIVENYDLICLENLNVQGMMKNRKLSKAVQEVSWYQLVSMLEYKSKWYGRAIQKIDRFYPSSKTCSECGHKLESLDLGTREWTCPSCGAEHDRDLNAALNILKKGLDDCYQIELTSDVLADYRRGEEVRLDLVHPNLASSMKRLG